MAAGAGMESSNLVLLGDTMLGRYVNDSFTWDAKRMQDAWGDVLPFIKNEWDPKHTIIAANLECAVTDHARENPKAFNFKLSPSNIGALKTLGADFVSLANNHILDYCEEGLAESVEKLDAAGIAHAGAGANAPAAAAPAVVEKGGLRVAFVGYSDHYEEWAARDRSPGINFIDPQSYDPSELRRTLAAAKQETGAQLLLAFVHWGPNWRWRPNAAIRRLGRAFIDAGADLVFGHSAHHIQGVEVHKGRAIVYGAGGFIDDYALDNHYRNDLSALWVANVTRPSTASEALGEPSGSTAASRPAAAGAAGIAAADEGSCDAGEAAAHAPRGTSEGAGVSEDRGSAAAAPSAGAYAEEERGGEGAKGVRISSLRVVPTRIRHQWRRNAQDAAPPGQGNPAYLSQVDTAHGDEYSWVASKLKELSLDMGTKVEALPNEAGLHIDLT